MKPVILLASIALVALTACSGGGSNSSTPPVTFSPVGAFSGTVTSPYEGQGGMAIQVNIDGSGEFALVYPSNNAGVDVTFNSSIGHISGSNFDIANTTIALNGKDSGCPFALHSEMVSVDEMDGHYNAGNNTLTCGNVVSIPFKLTRIKTQTQMVSKQHSSDPLIQH